MKRGSFHATARAAFADGEKSVRVYFRDYSSGSERYRHRARLFSAKERLPDELLICRLDCGEVSALAIERLFDLPLDIAREIAIMEPACRESYDVIDALRRGLKKPDRFAPPTLPRAQALSPDHANPWPDADRPHWRPLRGPSSADYGKRDGSLDADFADTLGQLGMRRDEHGRWFVTPGAR